MSTSALPSYYASSITPIHPPPPQHVSTSSLLHYPSQIVPFPRQIMCSSAFGVAPLPSGPSSLHFFNRRRGCAFACCRNKDFLIRHGSNNMFGLFGRRLSVLPHGLTRRRREYTAKKCSSRGIGGEGGIAEHRTQQLTSRSVSGGAAG